MARMYNIREGFTADNDTVPEIFFTDFTEGPLEGKGTLNKKDFEEAKRYAMNQWGEIQKESQPEAS